MKRLLPLALVAALVAPPLAAQPKSDQGAARKDAEAGTIMRSREIEARILPMMGDAEYLGFAYDSTAMAYRLKFIRDRRVLFIDVDARSGRIIQKSW
jgi:uncharacterized membrane protein YkoI